MRCGLWNPYSGLLCQLGQNYFNSLTVVVFHSPRQGSDVFWQFNGAPLDRSWYSERTRTEPYNTTVYEVFIHRASQEHEGTYECVTPYGTKQAEVVMMGEAGVCCCPQNWRYYNVWGY